VIFRSLHLGCLTHGEKITSLLVHCNINFCTAQRSCNGLGFTWVFELCRRNLLEHLPCDGDLGHLENNIAAVAHHLRADLDQLVLPPAGDPMCRPEAVRSSCARPADRFLFFQAKNIGRWRGSPCQALNGWTVCRFHRALGGAPEGKGNGDYRYAGRTKEIIEVWKAYRFAWRPYRSNP
jgi:hypothetical protein